MLAQVQSVVLPLWVEYVKALSAPIVASIAAIVAGVIAHRQSVTAKNKLKLDFFDKRMAIYYSAATLIKEMTVSSPVKSERVQELALDFVPSPWLLNRKVAGHLADLVECAYRNAAMGRVETVGQTEEQQMMEGFQSVQNKRASLDKELRKLNRLFEEYLEVKH